MAERTAIEIVRQAVEKWEGVTTHDHRFGGIEFRLGSRRRGTTPSMSFGPWS
jgi:hypothetical protein